MKQLLNQLTGLVRSSKPGAGQYHYRSCAEVSDWPDGGSRSELEPDRLGLLRTLTGDDLEISRRCCDEVSNIFVVQGRSAEVADRCCFWG